MPYAHCETNHISKMQKNRLKISQHFERAWRNPLKEEKGQIRVKPLARQTRKSV